MVDRGGLQLLPETRKKIDVITPGENKNLIIGSVVLAIAAVLAGAAYFYQNSLENKIASLDADIAALEQQRNKQAEQNILVFNKQLSMLSKLLNEHVYWTTAFSKIEGLTQVRVSFGNLTAILLENKVNFEAVADNYTTIARQIAAFISDESIKDVSLSRINTLTNGQLNFTMQIIFDKSKFLKAR